MSKTGELHKILAALSDAPATSTELADVLQMSRVLVSWKLSGAFHNRQVTRTVFHRPGGHRRPYLYQISAVGAVEIEKKS